MCYSIRNVILGPNTMKTYTLDQLRNFTSEQINDIQRPIDIDAQNYADSYKEALKFLSPEDFAQLKEYFTDTMEKYRLIYKAIVQTFKNEHNAGYPEFIYNIPQRRQYRNKQKRSQMPIFYTPSCPLQHLNAPLFKH